MRKRKPLTVLLFVLISLCSFAQDGISIEGYVYEDGNRGYLNLAKVRIIDPTTGLEKAVLVTDENGVFKCQLPVGMEYELFVEKDLFKQFSQAISTVGKADGEKVFVKCRLERKPGYQFEVTIAEKRVDDDTPVNAITGATIEVFNNSTNEQLLTLIEHPTQEFKCHFIDGNHYTILIRKKGFFNKRMEAFVNVKGCILCFEGVGEVKPSDVLTEGNTMGTLLANVELEPVVMDQGILLENILYDYNKDNITETAGLELDKLINVLTINPALVVELGSHTDSRGDDDYNFDLSSRRAKSAVSYILRNSDLRDHRIRYKGYGETQIKNKCKNGVQCSEGDHGLNRRTELKVVGLLDIDPYKDKALKDIIDAENFDKMLAELENQEQVKVFPGEDVPDFIKQQEKEKNAIAEKEGEEVEEETEAAKEEIKEEMAAHEVVVQEVTEVELSTNPKSEIETEVEVIKATKIEAPTTTSVGGKVVEKVKPKVETKPTEVVTTELPTEKEIVTPTQAIKEEVLVSSNADVKIYSDPVVETPRPTPKPVDLPNGYSGYRVEFYNSPYELPSSHEIFYRHGRITLDQTNEGAFSYLLGAFNEQKDAEDFLKNILAEQYPEAKVIRYKKGNRSNG